jgi:hypothetical protein
MLQKEDARRTTVHREKWKRKLDVGDVVHLAVHYSEAAHKSLVGLDGSTVLSIDGEWLTLLQAMTTAQLTARLPTRVGTGSVVP